MADWIEQYGLPINFFVDLDSIYRCERVATVAEQVTGKKPRTQFGRAMEQLAVELILAHSPQAKGRVERRNGLLQDRRIKELRLAGISDLARANEFLRQKLLPALKGKFNVVARSALDVHRKVPAGLAAGEGPRGGGETGVRSGSRRFRCAVATLRLTSSGGSRKERNPEAKGDIFS